MKLLTLIIIALALALIIAPIACTPQGDYSDPPNTATNPDGTTHHSGAQPQSQ